MRRGKKCTIMNHEEVTNYARQRKDETSICLISLHFLNPSSQGDTPYSDTNPYVITRQVVILHIQMQHSGSEKEVVCMSMNIFLL